MPRKPANLESYKLAPENEHLIENNYNLIRKVINDKFSVYYEYYDDMFQEGVVGLIRAAAKHNPNLEETDDKKQAQFSTYAYFCIKNEIQKFVSECTDTIRVPVSVGLAINGIRMIDEQEGSDDEKQHILKHNQISQEMLEAGRNALATVSMDEENEDGLPYRDVLPGGELVEIRDYTLEEKELYGALHQWLNFNYEEEKHRNRVYIAYLVLYEAQDKKISEINAHIITKYCITRTELREIIKTYQSRLRIYFSERKL